MLDFRISHLMADYVQDLVARLVIIDLPHLAGSSILHKLISFDRVLALVNSGKVNFLLSNELTMLKIRWVKSQLFTLF